MPDFPLLAQQLAIWTIPVVLAVTLREAARAWMARGLGDDTAARAWRLSFNPLRYLDPLGTLAVPAVLLGLGTLPFGWGRAAPQNQRRLDRPRRDAFLVAAAAPAANVAMMLGWALFLRQLDRHGGGYAEWPLLRDLGVAGVNINIILLVLHALPLPALDGGRIAIALLMPRLAGRVQPLERWVPPVLALLMAAGVLGALLFWPAVLVESQLYLRLGVDVR